MTNRIVRARRRRAASTDAERKLWYALRDRRFNALKFRRQHPLPPYTSDFYCAAAQLVVEVDGGQHAEEVARDERRTAFLKQQGLTVLRFWNNEVLQNLEGCLLRIEDVARGRLAWRLLPSPCPSPR